MKYLDQLRADPRVSDISDERAYDEGVWVYLVPGWVSDSTDTGTIHERTLADIRSEMRSIRQSIPA
jgi:hypothetical protein